MFTLEARNENQKVIGRAEFDNKKEANKWLTWFQSWNLVRSIKILKDETEYSTWER